MRFRAGALVGFAAGYYLGTKAGPERHEQINHWINKITENPSVQEATAKAREAVGLNGHGDRPVTHEPDVDLSDDLVRPIHPEVG